MEGRLLSIIFDRNNAWCQIGLMVCCVNKWLDQFPSCRLKTYCEYNHKQKKIIPFGTDRHAMV